jgi:flagellar biosynthesis repressor protein FlbT
MSGNGLVLKLAPGERVLVNGAVIENGDRRARLTLLTPNAHVLRLRDAIHPEEANTPVRRVCYIAQMAVAGEADPTEAQRQLKAGIGQLLQVFRDLESVASLEGAAAHAAEARFYPALRALRTLLPREAALLGVAAPASSPMENAR